MCVSMCVCVCERERNLREVGECGSDGKEGRGQDSDVRH